MEPVETELRGVVESAAPRLLAMSDEEAGRAPAPGKWSPKEILGHLIDSASNNHQRFVRAQFSDGLVFPGYDQAVWVAAQDYRSAGWSELVGLWRLFNLHLARVIENAPASARLQQRSNHNLHEIAWKTVPPDEPTTLEYFMRDYVGHLKHHLRQAMPDI